MSVASISVYQSYNPGAVERIGVRLGEGPERIVWNRGADRTAAANPVLVADLDGTQDLDRVTVYLDSAGTPGWNEIDAVCVKDSEGAVHPAERAEASTTYANRVASGAMPQGALPSWSELSDPSGSMSRGEVSYERRSAGAFGWPRPAWAARQTIEASRMTVPVVASLAGPMRAVPYQPLLSGILLNALVYLLMLALLRILFIVPLRSARRLLRMQRGECPRCGYDVRYNFSGGCPECGLLRER